METFESEIKKLEQQDKKVKQSIVLLESLGYTILPPKVYDSTDTSEFYCSRLIRHNQERYGTEYRISFFSFLRSDFIAKIKSDKSCVFAGFSVDIPRKIREEIEKNTNKVIQSLHEYSTYCVIINE